MHLTAASFMSCGMDNAITTRSVWSGLECRRCGRNRAIGWGPSKSASKNAECSKTWPMDTLTAGLRTILTGDQELAHINLCCPELGSEMYPFSVDPGSCQMLVLPKRVRFCSEKVCSINVTGMQPRWKDLSIDAASVNLKVEDTAALVRAAWTTFTLWAS